MVEGIYLDGGIDSRVEADLVVISSQWIEERALEHVPPGTRYIVGRRTISSHALEKLFALPVGTRVLLVNDIPSTARETVDSLSELGLGHLELFPYAPGMPVPTGLNLAVTPGETALVPAGIEKVIDIGVRVFDMTTVVEMCSALGILDEKAYVLSARYMRELVHLYRKVFEEAARTTKVKNELAAIVGTSHDGIVAVDEERRITVFNPAAEIIFEKAEREVLGRPADEVGFGGIIGRVIETGISEENDLAVFRDRTLVVNRLPIRNGAGHTAGAVATVKDITEIQEMEQELRQKLRGKWCY
ncbi:MAG: PAS domain S-box protein, partial [Actinobacteria bacterium]|nr:PAS domain S-box protein [Actinomycetota bacterium]